MMSSGTTKLAGVIGWPVGHSRSPLIHNEWFARTHIEGAYIALPVAPENLGAALQGLPALGFCGVNVTVPHKQAIIPFIDRLDVAATAIGAVNTVLFHDDGSSEGRNTDAFGFMENLRCGAPGWNAAAGPAVVLGAGGAARAIVWALLQAGAPDIRVVNRSPDRAAELAASFPDKKVQAVSWAAREAACEGAALLVNTTSCGMNGKDNLDMTLAALPATALVTDIVYTPLDTGLLRTARARRNPTVDGLGMLLHQARPAFAAWFGIMPEVDDALRALVLK